VFGTTPSLFTNGNGSLVLNPPLGPYPFGSTLQATALPDPGHYFFGWAGAITGFSNRAWFNVTSATPSITALFAPRGANQVSLTVLPEGNGTVSMTPSKNVYTSGETVTLTALPSSGNVFVGWSGDAAGTLNPIQLILDASKLVTATFAPGAPTNPPVITQSPLSRTLGAGDDTVLSFSLTGDGPFTYQWRRNGSPLAGASAPSLSLVNVVPSNAGLYDIVVTGPGGSATSAPTSFALFGMELVPGAAGLMPLLSLDGAPGTSYELEHTMDLNPSNWNLLLPVTLSGDHFHYVDQPVTNHAMRFYRAVPNP
jgi:hypothetical protein